MADSDDKISHEKVLFVDTSLDTHLALIVSYSDTVSDLKKKILHEHRLCYPNHGEIKIRALKVKRRGIFYHLSNSMPVKSAFDDVAKNWFVTIDTSTMEDDNDNRLSLNPDSSNVVAQVDVANSGMIDEVNLLPKSYPESLSNVIGLSLPYNENNHLTIQKATVVTPTGLDAARREELNNLSTVAYQGDPSNKITSLGGDKNNESDPPAQETNDEQKKEKEAQAAATGRVEGASSNRICNVQGCTTSDGSPETESDAKKKNRRRKTKSDRHGLAVIENDASACQPGESESQLESAMTKKRKIEDYEGAGSVKRNGILLCDSNKETSQHPTSSKHDSGNNQKNANAALDCLSNETLDGVNFSSDCTVSGKWKRRKKSSNLLDQEISGVPSSTEHVLGESVGVGPNDFSKEPGTASFPGQHLQGLPVSNSCAVSVKEKHFDLFNRDKRPSSQDAINAKNRDDAPQLATASATKKRRSSKKIILDDCQKPTTDQIDGFEERRELSHPESITQEKCSPSDMTSKEAAATSELVEANETVNPGTKSKKKKKNKRTDGLLTGTPTPDTAHVKSPAAATAISTEPHKASNGDDSNDKGRQEESSLPEKERKEKSEMDKEEAVTSELPEGNETVNPGILSKKRKKSKNMQDLSSRKPTSDMVRVKSSEAADAASVDHYKAVDGDDSDDKGNQEESNLPAKEGKEVSEMDNAAGVTSELAEARETMNPGIPSMKRKKSKGTKSLLCREPTLGTEHVESPMAADTASTEPRKAADEDDSNIRVNQQESNLPAKDGKEVSEMDKEVVVLAEARETMNPGIPSKKRKKSKGTKSLLCREPTLGTEHVESPMAADTASTEPRKAADEDDSNIRVNQQESNLPAKDGKEVLEMDKEVVVASELVEAGEAVNPGTSPSKKKNKSKRTRDLLSKAASAKEHVEESLPDSSSTKPRTAVNQDDMTTKKGNVWSEMDTPSTFHLVTDTEIDNVIQNVVNSAANGYPSKNDHADKSDHGMEVSCEGDMINFTGYFVSSQDHHETAASGEVLVNKVTTAKEAVNATKSNKKKKKLDAHSCGPPSDLIGTVRLNENDGIRENPQVGNSDNIRQKEPVQNGTSEKVSLLNKKPSEASGSGVKVPPSNKSDKINSTSEAKKSSAAKPIVINSFAKNKKEASAASNSSLGSSRNMGAGEHELDKKRNQINGRLASPDNAGELLHSSQQKGLIGKSGTIFQDDDYGGPADHRTDSSDASTKTPSDKSLSSDYSDGESNSDVTSSQNGHYQLKRKEGVGENIKTPRSFGLSLEAILRSSSRYKKAKLTASQSQLEDPESEPVDFVPDSQANP